MPAADPADPDALVAEWADLGDRTTPPESEIYAPDAEALTIEARFRLRFDGTSVEWTDGPWTPDALDVRVHDVALPDGAYWDPEQAARPSSLVVEVWAWVGDDKVHVESADTLRVAFPYRTEDPLFLDEALMESLAPEGVLTDADDADTLGAWEVIVAEGV